MSLSSALCRACCQKYDFLCPDRYSRYVATVSLAQPHLGSVRADTTGTLHSFGNSTACAIPSRLILTTQPSHTARMRSASAEARSWVPRPSARSSRSPHVSLKAIRSASRPSRLASRYSSLYSCLRVNPFPDYERRHTLGHTGNCWLADGSEVSRAVSFLWTACSTFCSVR